MRNIEKIPNGLRWDGEDYFFTYNILPTGYEIVWKDTAYVELDNNVRVMSQNNTTYDSMSFPTIEEVINYIYK